MAKGPKFNEAERDYCGSAQLKDRGWTEAMIRDLLGGCDKSYPNPHWKAGPPVRLWLLERAINIESQPVFADRLAKARKRSAASTKATGRKKDELLAAIAAQPSPRVPKMNDSTLTREACEHYNALWMYRDSEKYASPDDSKGFLFRITVNYLRHELTDYEQKLFSVAGKIGAEDARDAIRGKVLSAIGEAYPALAQECLRQEMS